MQWLTTIAGTTLPLASHRMHAELAARKARRTFCHLLPQPRSLDQRLSLRQLGSGMLCPPMARVAGLEPAPLVLHTSALPS